MSPLLLLVLACPIGMGLMMWFMGRGMRGGHGHANDAQPAEPVEQAR